MSIRSGAWSLFLMLFAVFSVQTSSAQAIPSAGANRPTGGRYSLFSINASPYLSIPIGAESEAFGIGGGLGLSAGYRFPLLPLARVGAGLDYNFVTTGDPATSLSLLSLGAEAGLHLQVLPVLALDLIGGGGWFVAMLNGPGAPPEGNPFLSGGVRLDFDVADTWGIGAAAAFRYYAGLLNDVSIGVTTTYRIPALATVRKDGILPPGFTPLQSDGRGLRIIGLKTTPIFPVFLKYYDDHPLAEIALRNFERVPAQSIKLTALLKGYMDSSRECPVPVRVEPGQGASAQVFALFNDRLLEVAETTKLTMVLTVEYTQYGKTFREEYSPSVDVLYRNAMTWDDDRRMAAFISARDPAASGFARGVLSGARAARNTALSQDLQSVVLFCDEALRAYGLAYVKDPASALNTKDRKSIDTLQFPQQTLDYRSGDCDDLTILMCSLLESIGIETAFITTPGHVLPAFKLDASPEASLKIYGNAEDFIVQADKVWVPLEMTILSQGFLGAWREGAREWAKAGEAAALYPVREAWGAYAPVVVSGTAVPPPTPSAAVLASALKTGIQALIDRELTPRAVGLLEEAKKQSVSSAPSTPWESCTPVTASTTKPRNNSPRPRRATIIARP